MTCLEKKAVEESQKRKRVCSDSFKIFSVQWQLSPWHGPSLMCCLMLQGSSQHFPEEIWVRNSICSCNSCISAKKEKKKKIWISLDEERQCSLLCVFCSQIAVTCYKLPSVRSFQGAEHARFLVQHILIAGAVPSIHHTAGLPLAKRLSYLTEVWS